jgi:D-alanine-D-alanine ligase
MRIGLLYGGSSPEYEVSLQSAKTILQHLDTSRFIPIPIHITPQSEWIIYDNSFLPFSISKELPKKYSTLPSTLPCDVIFSVLHGRLGEDGAIQGLLKVMDIPYVGSDILGSALGMNKVFAKQLVAYNEAAKIVPYWDFKDYHWYNNSLNCIEHIEKQFDYPLFIKPVNTGSSIGVSKVQAHHELQDAIEKAFQYDSHIMVEKGLIADEIEIAVLESIEYGQSPLVSEAGAIIPTHAFYSYEAKYEDKEGAILQIPAPLNKEQLKEIQTQASHIFEVLQCEGMARIDFFLEKTTQHIYFNELNTLPGFTEISMYPKLWHTAGKPLSELLTHLIQVAINRYNRNMRLKRLR